MVCEHRVHRGPGRVNTGLQRAAAAGGDPRCLPRGLHWSARKVMRLRTSLSACGVVMWS